MNKKFLLLILVILLGALGYFITQKTALVPSLTSKTQSAFQPTSTESHTAFVSELNEDIFLLITVSPPQLVSLLSTFTDWRTRLFNTSIAKKLNLEGQIEEQTNKANTPSLSSLSGPAFTEKIGELKKYLEKIAHVDISLSKNMLTLSPDFSIPRVLVRTIFGEGGEPYKLEQKLIGDQQNLNNKNFSLVKLSGKDHAYTLTMQNPKENKTIKGGLSFEEKKIVLTLGASGEDEFLTKNGKKSLAQKAKNLRHPTSGFAISYLVFPPDLKEVLTNLLKAFGDSGMQEKANETMQTLDSYLKGIQSASYSFSFNPVTLLEQCYDFSPDSQLHSLYEDYLSMHRKLSDAFTRVLSSDSIFALQTSKAALIFQLKAMQQGYGGLYDTLQRGSGVAASPEWNTYMGHIEILNKSLDDFIFNDIGLVVRSSPYGLSPEFGLYLGGVKANTLEELRDSLFEPIQVLQTKLNVLPSAQAELITSQQNNKPLLALTLGPQVSLKGGFLTKDAVFLANSESFYERTFAQIEKEETRSLEKELHKVQQAITDSETRIIINTIPLLEAAKAFVPILLMGKPELEISDDDVNEFAKLLEAKWLYTSSSSKKSGGIICQEGSWRAF